MLLNERDHLRVLLEMNAMVGVSDNLQMSTWNPRSDVFGLFWWTNPVPFAHKN